MSGLSNPSNTKAHNPNKLRIQARNARMTTNQQYTPSTSGQSGHLASLLWAKEM